MPLSHAKLWKALDELAHREGTSPSGLARRAGLDATSFNPSKRFGPGEPPRPRWPSTESLARVLEAAGLSLGAVAALADGGPTTCAPPPAIELRSACTDSALRSAARRALRLTLTV